MCSWRTIGLFAVPIVLGAVIVGSAQRNEPLYILAGAFFGALAGALLAIVGLAALFTSVAMADLVERYPSGRVKARGRYNQGRQGSWTFWHEDGWKKCEGKYEHDFESGVWTFFYPSGKRCAKGELDGWQRQGVWEFWDETGHLHSEEEFLACSPASVSEGFPGRAKTPPQNS